jgi:hypothetical protein
MRGVGCEFVDVDAVVDDRSVTSRDTIPGDVEFLNSLRDEDQGINPAYGVAPDTFAVGVPVAISAVPGVDDDRDSGQARGCDSVVKNKGVVSVKHVRTIHSESGSEVQDQAEREARGLSKRMHRYVCGLGLRRKLTWVAGAIDRGFVAFGFLLARQVYGQAFHSSEIKAW